MSDCIPAAELAALAGLPDTDARRLHVEACARCRAAWLEYRDFMEGDAADGSTVRLPDPTASAALDRAIAAACSPPRRRALPGLRLVVPLAAAAVLAFALLPGRDAPNPAGDTPAALRGEAQPVAPVLHAPRTRPDGALELRWDALAGASAYRVRFVGTDGARLGESAAQADTSYLLRPDALPAWLPVGGQVAWRVVATRDADDIVSAPSLVTVPGGR
ncbi:MAG: hypothetical protein IPK64_03830 [bacterium]|nr:hypothetical protein [bacterium]